jgi:hypothetical protein
MAIASQPFQTLDQGVSAAPDTEGILKQAAEAAKAGDEETVITLLRQARQALGSGATAEGSSTRLLARHLDQAIKQVATAQYNAREVASITIHQLQDTLQMTQGNTP